MQLPISESGALELLDRAVLYGDTELETALVEQAQRNNWTRVLTEHRYDHPENENERRTMADELSFNEQNLYGGRTSDEMHTFLNQNQGRAPATEGETKKGLKNAYALAGLDNADASDRARDEALAAQYDPATDLKYQQLEKAFGDKMPAHMKMQAGYFEPVRAAAQRLGIAVGLDEQAAQARKDVDAAREHRDKVSADPKSTSKQRSDAELALYDALAKLNQ